MNRSVHSAMENASVAKIFEIFRALGLRHLVVVDRQNDVRGVITRKDFLWWKSFQNGQNQNQIPNEANPTIFISKNIKSIRGERKYLFSQYIFRIRIAHELHNYVLLQTLSTNFFLYFVTITLCNQYLGKKHMLSLMAHWWNCVIYVNVHPITMIFFLILKRF